MKYLFSLVISLSAAALAAQTPLQNVERIINTKCIGSPSSRDEQKQTVRFKIVKQDSVEVVAETTDLKTGKFVRKNRYNFRLRDLDAEFIEVKQYGDNFGVFLHTKDQAGGITQATWLAEDTKPGVFGQGKMCISDFESMAVAEELQNNFTKAIKQSGQ